MIRQGLEIYNNFFCLTLLRVICCGFFLVTNVLLVTSFGQKLLLNALNVNEICATYISSFVSFIGKQSKLK